MLKTVIFIGLIFLPLMSTSFAANGSKYRKAFDLSFGYVGCLTDLDGSRCWSHSGIPDEFPSYLSYFPLFAKNPIQVRVNHWIDICSLSDEGAKCRKAGDSKGSFVFPPLKNPVQIGGGGGHSCVLDDDGVKCVTRDSNVPVEIPPLKNPRALSVGSSHSCAIDDNGVICWGENSHGELNAPPLVNPRQISAGNEYTCAIDDEGLKCWGSNFWGVLNVPPLNKPRQVSAGTFHVCALDIDGLKCWGHKEWGALDIPPLKKPLLVDTGHSTTCVLDIEGVKCWGLFGSNKDGEVGTILLPDYLWLEKIQAVLPPLRASYVNELVQFQDEIKNNYRIPFFDEHYFYLRLISPAVLSTDSAFFQQKMIPEFKKELAHFEEKLGYQNEALGLQNTPDDKDTRAAALVSIRASLSLMLNILSDKDQILIRESIRTCGLAKADPMNDQKVLDLLKQVDALSVEKQKLKSSPKSAFLVDSLELAANWLREKAK